MEDKSNKDTEEPVEDNLDLYITVPIDNNGNYIIVRYGN